MIKFLLMIFFIGGNMELNKINNIQYFSGKKL